jgi:hypothetical protein
MGRPCAWSLLVLVALPACGGGSTPSSQVAQSPPAPPRATLPPASVLPVQIVSVSPETIDVRNGRVVPTTFTVEYRIANPEKVSEAELRIESSGFGVLQRQLVPVEANTSVTMSVDISEDLGPLVRFRVVCPTGATEWRTLGAPPLPAEPSAEGLTLKLVGPSEIRPDYTGQRAGGERVSLYGSGFTAECTIEGQRDGGAIQLVNPMFRDGRFSGLLMHSDLDQRPVARRYLDFGLSIRGPGIGQINLKRVPFNE